MTGLHAATALPKYTRVGELHAKVWNLLKLAGRNKQGVDAQAAADLEAATKEFADMFWATKK